MAANELSSSNIEIKIDHSLPISNGVPMNNDNGISISKLTRMKTKKNSPRNFPNTISVMLIGDETSRVRVLLRFSSAIERMVMSGMIMSNIIAASENKGAITISVTPGTLSNCDN